MSQHIITGGRRTGKTLAMLFAYAANNDWQAKRTNGGHLRFTKPARPIIHTSSTPSDHRAVRNALAMLVRADRAASRAMIEAAVLETPAGVSRRWSLVASATLGGLP